MAAKVAVITAMLSIPFVLSCLSHPTRRRGRRRRKARKGPEAIKLHIKIAKLQKNQAAHVSLCVLVKSKPRVGASVGRGVIGEKLGSGRKSSF